MAVRKVAVTLPEELYDVVEQARSIEHRSRSDVIQEALRTHFGEPTYRPTADERAALVAALERMATFPHGTPTPGQSLPGSDTSRGNPHCALTRALPSS